MHPGDHPTPEAEAARYRLHRNDPSDPGYRAFLERLLVPAARHLEPGARGLDYGSGPQPALAALARERGFACEAHDPLFQPGDLAPPYDFVLASEVFEHFRCPAREIARVVDLLSRGGRGGGAMGGLLAVMTLAWRDGEDLSRWHYLSDPTHVSIYHAASWTWIAARYGLRVEWNDGERVVLLRRECRDGEC
jgi:hypothetical protein